jgi:hypothetical protein
MLEYMYVLSCHGYNVHGKTDHLESFLNMYKMARFFFFFFFFPQTQDNLKFAILLP